MGKISLPSAEQFDEINLHLKNIASKVGAHDVFGSWREVQAVCRRGQAKRYFKAGDQFKALFDGEPVVWVAVDVEDDSILIQPQDVLMNAQISTTQGFYHADTALSPGTHIFTLNSLQYKFTTTETVPEGGIIRVSSWGSETYVPVRAETLAADRVTVIENNINVTTATGADTLSPINHHHRVRYGSDNYKESAIRQWLNSESSDWQWRSQTDYDRPSSYGKPEGFLKRLDPDLLAVIGESEIRVARNTVTDDGGQDILNDKVFLLSRVEVGFGTEGDTTGEKVLEYYDGATKAKRIKLLDNSPRIWWLRSPGIGDAISVRLVNTSGAYGNSDVRNSYGLAPACRIK